MSLPIIQNRNRFTRFKEALWRKRATIGFIGGSITDAAPRCNWPEPVVRWLVGRYPEVRFTVENAGIGATGSDLAVFRAQRDLIDRKCDLVFVEYAVNDEAEPSDKRMRTREGLLRKLLRDGERDVALVYTYSQNMYGDMVEGRVPDTIAEFERLAEHYGLNSAWMGLHAFNEVKLGMMRWEDWLPDGLHPTQRGSLSYGDSVVWMLEKGLEDKDVRGDPEQNRGAVLPAPLHTKNWEEAFPMSFDSVRTEGPWSVRRSLSPWIDQVLETSAVGSLLRFAFFGRGLLLGFDFGKRSAEFRYRFDGGDWVTVERERPAWCGDYGWYRVTLLADDLPKCSHDTEIEVVHGNREGCMGTNFELALIGILL